MRDAERNSHAYKIPCAARSGPGNQHIRKHRRRYDAGACFSLLAYSPSARTDQMTRPEIPSPAMNRNATVRWLAPTEERGCSRRMYASSTTQRKTATASSTFPQKFILEIVFFENTTNGSVFSIRVSFLAMFLALLPSGIITPK